MPLFSNIKRFSYLLSSPLCFFGLCAVVINPCLAGQEQQKAEFAVAYDEYQECVSHKDVECELAKADVALKLGKNIFPLQGKNIANLTGNHAVALMKTSKDKLMVYQNLQLALAVNEGAFGADSEEVLAILNYLHAAQIDLDKKVKTKATYWLTIKELSAKLYGETSVAHAESLMSVSSIMLLGHAYNKKKALAMAMQAYDIFLSKLGEKNPKTAYVAFNIGKYYLAREKNSKAIQYLNSALLGFEAEGSPDNRFGLSAHAFLVEAYENSNKRDAATEHCLAIGSMTPDDPNKEYLPLFKRPPEYTDSALASREEGYVLVEYTVDEMGFVVNPSIVGASTGKGLQQAAMKAALKFRYAPRFEHGKSVATHGVKNKFNFRLN